MAWGVYKRQIHYQNCSRDMFTSDVYLVLVKVLTTQTDKWMISAMVQEEINIHMPSNDIRISSLHHNVSAETLLFLPL